MTVQVNIQERNVRPGRHAVIVGGGISGLSTAFFLSQRASKEHLPLKITVLEASDRFGGVLRTLSHGGWVMEAGADAFYSGQNDAADLCRALGLQEELVEAAPCFRRFFILKNKKYFSVPGLSRSFFDTTRSFASFPVSFSAKYRMLLEPFIPRRKEAGDESFASFICRRLGHGFYEEIAKPLIRGVYMVDPERLSLGAMFPRFHQAERDHGSLAGSFLSRRDQGEKKNSGEFLTLKNGLEGLVRALVSQLGSCDLRRSSVVKQCAFDKKWKVLLEGGEKICADALCLAMGSSDASQLLSGVAPELSRELSGIRYDSIAAVNFIFRSDDKPVRDLGCGFLVPFAGEGHPFSSLKWLGKTADGKHLLVRAFISEAMLPGVFHENDEMLGQKIRISLQKIFGMQANPEFISVERYPRALPQYETGHLERVARIEEKIRRHPGLHLAGNGLTGFGITDCIRRARIVISDLQLPVFGNQS